MTSLLVYASITLIVFSAVVSRFTQKRLRRAQNHLINSSRALEDLERQIAEANHRIQEEEQAAAAFQAKAEEERLAIESGKRRLAEAQASPVERMYAFDRQEPRPGVIWSARIKCSPDSALPLRLTGGWSGTRDVLIIAAAKGEVEDRLKQRFGRHAGFEIIDIAPCPLFNASSRRTDAGSATVIPFSKT